MTSISTTSSTATATLPALRRLTGAATYALCVLLAGCSSAPVAPLRYDLGGAPSAVTDQAACTLPALTLIDVAAPGTLDNDLMLYRLLYANDQQIQAYGGHRWSMPPAQLLTQRVKAQLADHGVTLLDTGVATSNGIQLRLVLNDFSQYFSDPSHSYGQITVRATLLRGRSLIAQSTFKQQTPATSPDAPAGAQALRSGSDTVINALTSWLCKQNLP